MTKNKIPFNKLDEATKQDIAKSFINNHIYIRLNDTCVSYIIHGQEIIQVSWKDMLQELHPSSKTTSMPITRPKLSTTINHQTRIH